MVFAQIIMGGLFFYDNNYYVKINHSMAVELIDANGTDKKMIDFSKHTHNYMVKEVQIEPS